MKYKYFTGKGNIDEVIRKCLSEGFKPMYLTEVIDKIIACEDGSDFIERPFLAPSILVTGFYNGFTLTYFVNAENYFSNPENISNAIKQGLLDGAGKIPHDEFKRIANDKKDIVKFFGHGILGENCGPASTERIELKEKMNLPYDYCLVRLLGKERADRYLSKLRMNGEYDFLNALNLEVHEDQPVAKFLGIRSCFSGIIGPARGIATCSFDGGALIWGQK